jgi:hypothetical protein
MMIYVEFLVSGSIWNCLSAVKNAEFISVYPALHSLDLLALTETWITPENTTTLAALFSYSESIWWWHRDTHFS